MFMSLILALIQSTIVIAQDEKVSGSGIRVYPDTGLLEIFKGVSWRYNGEMLPWGANNDLDFVPTVKDGLAVQRLEADPFQWAASPEVTSVFSLDFPYTSGNNISVEDAVMLQKRISIRLHGKGGRTLLLGAPSLHGAHDSIDGFANDWMDRWVKACNGECPYDFIAFDFEGDDAKALEYVLIGLHEKYKKPIWIKGFTCTTWENLPCGGDKTLSFMRDSIEYFRSTSFVERWVWDGASPDIDTFGDPAGMLTAEGALTPAGEWYLDS